MAFLNPKSTAFLFPGRHALLGAFSPADLSSQSHIARQTFDFADDQLGVDFSNRLLISRGDEFTRPLDWHLALFLNQVVLLRIFYEALPFPFEPLLTAGSGAGEITAMMAAGAFSFQEALAILSARAAFISEAEKDRICVEACLSGIDQKTFEDCRRQLGEDDLLVLTGTISQESRRLCGPPGVMARMKEITLSAGGHMTELPLPSYASTSLLTPYRESFAAAVDPACRHKALLKMIAASSDDKRHRPIELRQALLEGLDQPFNISHLVRVLLAEGVTDVVSFGSVPCFNTIGSGMKPLAVSVIETFEDIGAIARKQTA